MYRLPIQQQRNLELKRVDRVAAMQRGLDFADMCAGAAFEAYQRNDAKYLDILRPYMVIKDFTNLIPAEQPIFSTPLHLSESPAYKWSLRAHRR